MKKVFVTAIIIIGFAAAALGFGFFIGTKYPPALWIGIGGLVVGLGAYLIDGAIAYIAATPELRDVLVSGGDPLLLEDDQLEYVLKDLN